MLSLIAAMSLTLVRFTLFEGFMVQVKKVNRVH